MKLLLKAIVTQEQKDTLEAFGYDVVESVAIGQYDLVLTYFQLFDNYHLAIQRDGQEFSNLEQMMSKTPNSIGARMSEAIPVINKWIKQYGELWIASHNPSKTKVYKRILERLGYSVREEIMMGIQFLSLYESSQK